MPRVAPYQVFVDYLDMEDGCLMATEEYDAGGSAELLMADIIVNAANRSALPGRENEGRLFFLYPKPVIEEPHHHGA